MCDILIKNIPGDYSNEDACNRVLGYISQKAYIGGFGFSFTPGSSIIEQFRLSETYSNHPDSRKMWHFIITFQQEWPSDRLYSLAVQVSGMFAEKYQILFGLDYDKKIPHLHFGMNAFSYHPDVPQFKEKEMQGALVYLQQILLKEYPGKTVALEFTMEENKNV